MKQYFLAYFAFLSMVYLFYNKPGYLVLNLAVASLCAWLETKKDARNKESKIASKVE